MDTLIDNLENVKFAFKKMISYANEKYTDSNFDKWYKIDIKFWRDWQDGLIELPDYLKNETGKKSEQFLNWVRAQRFLIYFDNSITLDEAINLNKIYMQSLTEKVIPIKNAYETLKYLSTKYYIIIATNGPKIATQDKLLKINCLEFVNEVLSADMFGYMKPDPRFFSGIKNMLQNFNNEDYLIVGDSLKSDVGFACNCGFDSCWFNKDNEKCLEIYKPTIIINDLKELIKIL